jgi:drug/metabolite transporter (DMT)-like permease
LSLQIKQGHTQKLNWRILIYSAILGLFGYYIASWLDLTGLLYLPANLERLVLYSYPTIVLILTVAFLGQRLSAALLASLLLIYSGLLIVFANDVGHLNQGQHPQQLLGAGLVFASAAAFAVFFVGAEVMLRKISSPLFTAIAMISASIAIVSHYLFSQPWQLILQQPLVVYYYGAAIAIFCTVIPSFLVAAGIKRVGAATGSMVGGISPVLTLFLAFVFLGESISIMQALGFTVVIIGVLNLGRLKRKA